MGKQRIRICVGRINRSSFRDCDMSKNVSIHNKSRAFQRRAPETSKTEEAHSHQHPLDDRTIARLNELRQQQEANNHVDTYDLLILELIRNYRKKKGLGNMRGYEQTSLT